MNIYVGNISYNSTEDDLREAFGQYGEVTAVRVITDRDTGRSKGFGFVEMENADDAAQNLDGYSFEGRNLKVNEARDRGDRRGGGGGGGYR